MRPREELARLVPGGVHHLGSLPLALLAVALDLGLTFLQLVLPATYLFFGLPELRGRCVLGVALDRVGELCGGADEVQRVHPDGVPRRLDRRASAGGLEDAQLRLQLCGVTAKRIEGLAHALRVEPIPGLR